MKVRAYRPNRQRDPELFLSLRETEYDGVEIFAVDPDGNPIPHGTVLRIGREGITRMKNIQTTLNLPTDVFGRVALYE